jgi:dipeptidyl aminopeptidase/acylaminoacyl peptidase
VTRGRIAVVVIGLLCAAVAIRASSDTGDDSSRLAVGRNGDDVTTTTIASPDPDAGADAGSDTSTTSEPDQAPAEVAAPPSTTIGRPASDPSPPTTATNPTPWRVHPAVTALDRPGIYVLEPDSQRLARVLVEEQLVPNATFSPDGRRLAFGVADRLDVMNLDGTARVTVVAGGVAPLPVLWSPDGTTLAFVGRDLDGYRLKVVGVADRTVRVLAPEIASVRGFDWHPDGASLLFSTLEPGIHVVNADGSGLGLHHATERQVIQVFWSPSGRRVLYTSNGRLFTYDPNGGGARELGFDSGGQIRDPWSPDSSRIAIGRGFRYSLYGADGGEQSVDRPAIVLVWSPDGGSLLTRREQPGAPPPSATQRSLMDLVLMRPDGSGERTILADKASDLPWGHDFAWRPQGDLVVFSVATYRPDYPRYDRN